MLISNSRRRLFVPVSETVHNIIVSMGPFGQKTVECYSIDLQDAEARRLVRLTGTGLTVYVLKCPLDIMGCIGETNLVH